MKLFLESKGLYLAAVALFLIAITMTMNPQKKPSTQADSKPTTALSEHRKSQTSRTSTTSQQAVTPEADHEVTYDLPDAITAFEEKARTESENLSARDLQLLGELISNLNEFQNDESSR